MKKLLITCFLSIIVKFGLFSQIWVEIDIPNVKQEGSKLCWAASFSSIDKFYNPSTTITQKKLVDILYNLRNKNIATCPGSYSCTNTTAAANTCNLDVKTLADGYEYLQILNRSGYYAMQDNISLTWEEIKMQINQIMPFILVSYNYEPDSSLSKVGASFTKWRTKPFTHAIVAKGYVETISGEKFVLVNDPLACNGKEYMGLIYLKYPFSNNSNTINRPINAIRESIHDIRPKTAPICTVLSPPSKLKKKNELPPFAQGTIISYQNSEYKTNSLASVPSILQLENATQKKIKVKYLTRESLKFHFFQKPKSEYLQNEITDVYDPLISDKMFFRYEKDANSANEVNTAGYEIPNTEIRDRLLNIPESDYVIYVPWENNCYHFRASDRKISPIVQDLVANDKIMAKTNGEFIDEKLFLRIQKKKYVNHFFPILKIN